MAPFFCAKRSSDQCIERLNATHLSARGWAKRLRHRHIVVVCNSMNSMSGVALLFGSPVRITPICCDGSVEQITESRMCFASIKFLFECSSTTVLVRINKMYQARNRDLPDRQVEHWAIRSAPMNPLLAATSIQLPS